MLENPVHARRVQEASEIRWGKLARCGAGVDTSTLMRECMCGTKMGRALSSARSTLFQQLPLAHFLEKIADRKIFSHSSKNFGRTSQFDIAVCALGLRWERQFRQFRLDFRLDKANLSFFNHIIYIDPQHLLS